MIMPAGRQLLLPANPRFIAFTLILGLLLVLSRISLLLIEW